MNTHESVICFGKFEGTLLTRVPVSYLKWTVSSGCVGEVRLKDGTKVTIAEAAKAEIARRGERLGEVEISMHAIDRASLYYIPKFRLEHGNMEGLVSWLYRVTCEAWRQKKSGERQADGVWKIEYDRMKFVIEEMVVPILKTVE